MTLYNLFKIIYGWQLAQESTTPKRCRWFPPVVAANGIVRRVAEWLDCEMNGRHVTYEWGARLQSDENKNNRVESNICMRKCTHTHNSTVRISSDLSKWYLVLFFFFASVMLVVEYHWMPIHTSLFLMLPLPSSPVPLNWKRNIRLHE